MARVLPPPLLLLLLVKLNSGSSSSLVQPDCTDGSTPVEKGNSAVVYEGLAEKEKDLTIKLYVWVAEDFKGVTLEVTGKSGGKKIWLSDDIFSRNKWQTILIKINISDNIFTRWRTPIDTAKCMMNDSLPDPSKLSITAYGSSWWLNTSSINCSVEGNRENDVRNVICEEPPITLTKDLWKTMKNWIIVAAVFLVAVVMGVIMCYKCNTANPGEVGNAQYVTENDLYESLDYCKDRSLNDNNTKGNAANPGEAGNAQHVTENDLYESFEYHIKDHSLHGKFDNNTKVGFSPVKREAPYTTENELYESFSSCGHRYDQ
ncbi:uncharacterized protein LOC135098066 isoform X2 [Scylla paramamosain]|uniref:uncharacterized protein LOC135098066 isoform X2 n=1 Tax=Scylla paramamosain TaxID=85552 RepID=UPI0030833D5B